MANELVKPIFEQVQSDISLWTIISGSTAIPASVSAEENYAYTYPELSKVKGVRSFNMEDTIKNFSGINTKIDILVVKQMASQGIYVPHLKVALDLSIIRTVASCIQRTMRVATLYEGVVSGTYIAPYDPHGSEILDVFIKQKGGLLNMTIVDELIDQYETETVSKSTQSSIPSNFVFTGIGEEKIMDLSNGSGTMRPKEEILAFQRQYHFMDLSLMQASRVMDAFLPKTEQTEIKEVIKKFVESVN